MPKVILESTHKAPCRFETSLYHEVYCRRTGECACKSKLSLNKQNKQVVRYLPASISIPQGGRSGELHAAALHIPQVKEWLRLGYFKRHDVPDSALPPEALNPPELSTRESEE